MSIYTALLTSLPTGNSAVRMRVWRALRTTGCGVLRDGVYVLPQGSAQAASLIGIAAEIKAAGGTATIAEMSLKDAAELERVRKMFDRGKDYGALVARIHAAKATLQRLGKRKTDTLVQRLRRSLAELLEIDFYPGPARLQAQDAMAGLEQAAQALRAPGEPQPAKRTVRRREPRKYRNRTWATRKDLWVDRMASAWLIKRFIDGNAKFKWLDRPRSKPAGAVGFDFDGAEFTHVDGRVTFEVLLASFGLDDDPALSAIGRTVHFLDVGGIPVADAKGLETMLRGIKAGTKDDDRLLAEASRVFDSFYSAYAQPN